MEKAASFAKGLGREADGRSPLLRHPWALPAAAFAFAFALMMSIGSFWDNDINYIIALGRSILSDGLPWTDPLTCNDGLNCIAQQWLFCVACALLYDNLGGWSVAALVVALWACAALVMSKLALREGGGPRAASVGVAVALALLAAFMKTNPRAIDVLALLVSTWAALKWLEGGERRWLLLPVACSAGLANLHCTMWPVAGMPLFAALFDERAAGRRRDLVAAACGVAAASAASPYGIWSSAYVALSLSSGLSQLGIGELEPPTFSYSMPMFIPFLAVFALLIASRFSREGFKRPDALEVLALILAAMSFSQVRNMVLFWPVCAALIARELARGSKATVPGPLERPATVAESLARLGAVGVLVVGAVGLAATAGPSSGDQAASREQAVRTLQEAGVEPGAAVCNSFGSGGWLELAGYRPTFDERAEMFLPQINGGQDIASTMARYRAHYPEDAKKRVEDEKYAAAVFAAADERWYSEALEQCGYERAYGDEELVVWIRR